jgi:hypothetical protein
MECIGLCRYDFAHGLKPRPKFIGASPGSQKTVQGYARHNDRCEILVFMAGKIV